jgi:hypothetical protein
VLKESNKLLKNKKTLDKFKPWRKVMKFLKNLKKSGSG